MLGEYQFLGYPPDKDIHISFFHLDNDIILLLILNVFTCLGQISYFHIFQSDLLLSNFKMTH
jgi:hypothetical protein